MKKGAVASFLAAVLVTAAPAAAHFQVIFAPDQNIGPGQHPLKLLLTHPLGDGPVVDMPEPLAVYAVNRRAAIDLGGTLSPVTIAGADASGAGYDANLSINRVGDYVVVVEGGYYYDAITDSYIQSFAKATFNYGGLTTDWNRVAIGLPRPFESTGLFGNETVMLTQTLGLPTEILPLTKPYNVIAGGTFTGVLLREGRPLPNFAVEIVYLSTEPDMETNRLAAPTFRAPPGGPMTVLTDNNGVFTVGTPFPGYWGFAAIGSGPDTEHEGKYLFQDAVLWIDVLPVDFNG